MSCLCNSDWEVNSGPQSDTGFDCPCTEISSCYVADEKSELAKIKHCPLISGRFFWAGRIDNLHKMSVKTQQRWLIFTPSNNTTPTPISFPSLPFHPSFFFNVLPKQRLTAPPQLALQPSCLCLPSARITNVRSHPTTTVFLVSLE